MNIGLEILMAQWRFVNDLAVHGHELFDKIQLEKARANPPLSGQEAAQVFSRQMARAPVFYVEPKIFAAIPEPTGIYTSQDLPYNEGLLLFDTHGFIDRTEAIAWIATGHEPTDAWTIGISQSTRGTTIMESGGFSSDGKPIRPDMGPRAHDQLLEKVMRFALSSKGSVFRVKHDADQEGFKEQARVHELKEAGEGPHIITLRALASRYRELETHREIDWKSRWHVRGHARHLANGTVTRVKPYIKGPPNAPLKQSVYDVSR